MRETLESRVREILTKFRVQPAHVCVGNLLVGMHFAISNKILVHMTITFEYILQLCSHFDPVDEALLARPTFFLISE